MKHCSPPASVKVLAMLPVVYAVASLLYLVMVKALALGTPFRDSLSPWQLQLRKASTQMRARVFAISTIASAAGVFVALRCRKS